MVRNYKRQTQKLYSNENLRNAMKATVEGMPVATAARTFCVPRTTLRDNMGKEAKPQGGVTTFSAEQERDLKDRSKYLCNRGFPLTIIEFLKMAYQYAKVLERRKLLNGNIPNGWNC